MASVLTGILEVAGVWLASIGIHSAGASAWVLLTNQPVDEISHQAALGAAVGFIVGIPLTISAALALALS